jgi:rubrerythrin
MELDGKKFYTQAGQKSNNKLGKELFPWLAKEEDNHRKRFEEIYHATITDNKWPEIDIKLEKGKIPVTLFASAIKEAGNVIANKENEMEVADKALEMELKSRDYYRQQADKSKSAVAKKFFIKISEEEQGHYLAIVDYKEYVTDPVGWFTRTEHHLLDGA